MLEVHTESSPVSSWRDNLRLARWDRQEWSGSLGDLGTFLPLLVAMVSQNGLDFTAALFFAGVFNLVTGMLFPIPMAVQPMKAIAAVALTQHLSPGQIAAAGLGVSVCILVLAVFGLVNAATRLVPKSVIRGVQLAVGLQLLIKGVQMVGASGGWLALDGFALALAAGALVLRTEGGRVPSALILFGLGALVAVATHPACLASLGVGLNLPHWAPIGWPDLRTSLMPAVVPQVPLTLLNSVIAVGLLAHDLFPERPVSNRKIAVSVGLMNLLPAFFGGMPMCHGAGGLAGQVRFGARTNGAVLILGALKLGVAVLFGSSLLAICKAFPTSVLGVMLVFSGLELSLVARDQNRRHEALAMLVTAGASLAYNAGLGLVLGWAVARYAPSAVIVDVPQAGHDGAVMVSGTL